MRSSPSMGDDSTNLAHPLMERPTAFTWGARSAPTSFAPSSPHEDGNDAVRLALNLRGFRGVGLESVRSARYLSTGSLGGRGRHGSVLPHPPESRNYARRCARSK